MKTTANLLELDFELLPHPPYSKDLTSNELFLFSDSKRIVARMKSPRLRPILEQKTNHAKNRIDNFEDGQYFQY